MLLLDMVNSILKQNHFILGGFRNLATHVLQFVFLGYTGFKWPVAYFCTTEAHAAELMEIVREVVDKLDHYDFKVCYCYFLNRVFSCKSCTKARSVETWHWQRFHSLFFY